MCGNSLHLPQGGLDLILGKIYSLKGWAVRHWNRLPREVVKSLFLEVFKKCLPVALRDTV